MGLVLAQLSATGQLAAVHELDVPEVVQAADAKAASNAFPQSFPASFRFRGFSSDHRRAVLNTSNQVVTYSFIDHQLRPLAPSRLAVPTVLYIDADRLAISWAAKPGDPLPDFELVALP
ncbi:MAG: hypothetical protein JWR44_747 [Hymenobacter sp.]|nr:hypothetical protein [Hymenobacter sp.]